MPHHAEHGLPQITRRLANIGAPRADEGLGPGDLGLDGRARGEPTLGGKPRRLLSAGERDELVDGHASDAEAESGVGDVGPAHELVKRLGAERLLGGSVYALL